jgi:hypothetical protein
MSHERRVQSALDFLVSFYSEVRSRGAALRSPHERSEMRVKLRSLASDPGFRFAHPGYIHAAKLRRRAKGIAPATGPCSPGLSERGSRNPIVAQRGGPVGVPIVANRAASDVAGRCRNLLLLDPILADIVRVTVRVVVLSGRRRVGQDGVVLFEVVGEIRPSLGQGDEKGLKVGRYPRG